MPDLTFNTPEGQTVARELLLSYLNTGTAELPVWSPFGIRVEDSQMEMDWGKETTQDVLGNTYTSMKKPTITQSFDPWPLTSNDTALVKLWNVGVRDQDAQALANQDVLIVHRYAGTSDTAVFSERYPSSAISINNLGGPGGGQLNMASEITYGGVREIGTAKIQDGAVTFTADT